MNQSTTKQQVIAKSRKAMSECYNSTLELLNTLFLGVGSLCQVPFGGFRFLISVSNEHYHLPFGDDKSQPLV
jgi:hypothetical protein